ncbi:unnamed protein product [Gongylonema pulchrum]|uniref:G_PROTEIN_RECEP_F1_2 domain-containing protein n=1 Tax=Gongylonema pulchrum TaxID=637853 RepID=A0A183CZN3_9BILA|nr:unnamed protein product [Gongylonema pulchrum]
MKFLCEYEATLLVDTVKMPPLTIVLLLVYAVIILIALGGNILLCAAVLCDRKLRRQQENLFLVSLAVSDLLVSILVMSFAAANDILGYWPFGHLYCQLWICCDITCTTASILNLSAIAVHRFWHISRPLVYIKRRKICIAIAFVWLISASIGITQIIFELAQRNVTIKNSCRSEPACELRLKPPYALGSSMCSFFIPATMMVLLYTRLYLYARKHVRIMRAQLQQAANFVIVSVADERIRKVSCLSFAEPLSSRSSFYARIRRTFLCFLLQPKLNSLRETLFHFFSAQIFLPGIIKMHTFVTLHSHFFCHLLFFSLRNVT